jgi:hypothetical protein
VLKASQLKLGRRQDDPAYRPNHIAFPSIAIDLFQLFFPNNSQVGGPSAVLTIGMMRKPSSPWR